MKLPLSLSTTLALWCIGVAQVYAEPAQWSYRGFTVSHEGAQMDDSLRRAVAQQIDIVSAVGLGRNTMEFFQSVPLVVVPAGAIRRGTPGLYVRGDRVVKLTSRITSVGHKPVLLHELHAYHDRKIAGGFWNPGIRNLYEHAKVMMAYDSKSHMMQNPAEFFACTSTTFLFGVTAQEPFRREQLLKQSELLQFLSETFGPTCGSYEGSLSGQVLNQFRSQRLAAWLFVNIGL